MSKILTQNLNFRGHLQAFGAQNTPKSRPFEAKNKAQTLPRQLQNNFEKVQKSTFLTPKKGEIMLISDSLFSFARAKNTDFGQKSTKIRKSASNKSQGYMLSLKYLNCRCNRQVTKKFIHFCQKFENILCKIYGFFVIKENQR